MKDVLLYIKRHKIKITEMASEMRCSVNHLSCVLHGKHNPSHAFQSLLFNTLLQMMYSKRAQKALDEQNLSEEIKKLKQFIEEKK